MHNDFPKFWIYAVVDGENQGLYVEKQKSEHAELEKVYFHITNGLRPTEEMLKLCGGNSKYLYTKDDKEERIFNEIVSYALNFASHGRKGEFEFTGTHPETRGYQEVVDRYYEDPRMSPFKDFFESAATLKKHVLTNVRGKHHLAKGTAEQFGVLPPHKMMARDFEYLDLISDVLKIGVVTPKKRLRKVGPLAVDFDDERIYPRERLLEKLKRLVMGSSVSMLVGKSATGKTVLIRQLAYRLYTVDEWAVYYFDCDLDRDFDWRRLIKEINSVKGILFLENIHLATHEFQRIYDKIDKDTDRHVLLSARPQFREQQSQRDVDLRGIKTIELTPFDEIDKIIDHFASRHEEVKWPNKIRESIKNVSKENFWLLSYALEGYVSKKGKGTPLSWLERGVRADLEEMENLDPHFPEVFVALSPLYQNETLTEESFLTKNLSFSLRTLNELVCRGEITRHEMEGEYVLYGLPHSSLAEAYWEYGKIYSRRMRLPRYEEFVYSYVISDVPNGLEAIVDLDRSMRQTLETRLTDEDKMVQVVRREHSSLVVFLWVSNYICFDDPNAEHVLQVLTDRLVTEEDIFWLGYCLSTKSVASRRLKTKIWRCIDVGQLATRANECHDLRTVASLITATVHAPQNKARDFFDFLYQRNIAQMLIRHADLALISTCLRRVFQANTDAGYHLFDAMYCCGLPKRLSEEETPKKLSEFILSVREIKRDVAKDVCRMLDYVVLARRLCCTEYISCASMLIDAIDSVDDRIAFQLGDSLNHVRRFL